MLKEILYTLDVKELYSLSYFYCFEKDKRKYIVYKYDNKFQLFDLLNFFHITADELINYHFIDDDNLRNLIQQNFQKSHPIDELMHATFERAMNAFYDVVHILEINYTEKYFNQAEKAFFKINPDLFKKSFLEIHISQFEQIIRYINDTNNGINA